MQTNALQRGAPVTSRALFCLFPLVRQATIPLPAREFSPHDRWNARAPRLIRSRRPPRLSGNEGLSRMTERPEVATVNSLTQQRDHPGKTIKRERLIRTRAPRPSCYYSVLRDDRVTPEGDQVMSRGDPEVGQLRGVRYVIHIHKRRPVVALNCLFCSSGPARCLNVKQPPRAAMLIRAIESDCRVYTPSAARAWIICRGVHKRTPRRVGPER